MLSKKPKLPVQQLLILCKLVRETHEVQKSLLQTAS